MIEVIGLTKSYVIGKGRHYVFRDVSFAFPEKANIGIMGPNGAGKSTLLRILGGIDHPDSGRIKTDVSISWPLGLKGGFVGHMTGRENCRMICNAYGMALNEIQEKLEYIKELSGIGPYFEQPVAYYSSGMGGRLGFAMSMAFDFDYFLIDEITSVGDGHFKKLAKEALEKKRATSNIIMVSHSMGDLKKFCDVAVFIKDGKIQIFEDWDDAIEAYMPKSEVKTSVAKLTEKVKDDRPQVTVAPSARLLADISPMFEDVERVRDLIDGDTAAGLMQISNAFMRINQHLVAYRYAEAACDENPFLVSVYMRKAVLEGMFGKHEDRMKSIEAGLKLDPNHAGLNLEKSRYCTDQQRYTEAAQFAELSLSVNPDDIRAWLALALAQFRSEDFEACLKTVAAGLGKKKEFAPLLGLKYEAQFQLGNHEAAFDEFVKEPSPQNRKESLDFALRILEDHFPSLAQNA